jgi:hypothetical protein
MERELRLPLNWERSREDEIVGRGISAPALRNLLQIVVDGGQRSLDVVDYLLQRASRSSVGGAAESLEMCLREGGSKWCVSTTRDSLEERVAAEVAERAAQVMTAGKRAGQHLREAWGAVYGRNPSPSHAYREAVRAVEAAAIPVVLPNDATATLGKVIRDIKTAPEKRSVALQPAKGDPVQYVIGMLELLWTSQFDRHGTADDSVPLSVNQEQAEAAVHLALTLTHWFEAGLVR